MLSGKKHKNMESSLFWFWVLRYSLGRAVTFLRKNIHNDALPFIGPIRSLRAYVQKQADLLTRPQHSETGITVATQFMGI